MVDLNRIVGTLQATRRELTQQLDAIDKAIAALVSAAPSAEPARVPRDMPAVATDASNTAPTDAPPAIDATLKPKRILPRRILNDAHKEALAKGRRRAREVREAAAGRARELPDDSFVPALAPLSGAQPPRLIKKQQGVA
jgi:hypothetical protein